MLPVFRCLAVPAHCLFLFKNFIHTIKFNVILNLNLSFFSSLEDIFDEWGALGNIPKIFVTKPLKLLKLLRNFGHLIKILGINYFDLNVKISAEIETNYLAAYCSDSLQRLYLKCDRSSTFSIFENLQEPLKNVRTLGIMSGAQCALPNTQYLNENKLPNLQQVILQNYYYYHLTREESSNIYYKNIERFSLYCYRLSYV